MTQIEQQNAPALRFSGFESERNRGLPLRKFSELFDFSSGKNIKQGEASPGYDTPCVRYGELYHLYGEVITKTINKTNLPRSELKFSEGNEILLPSAGEDPFDISSASALTVAGVAIGRTINILRPLDESVCSHTFVSYYINAKLRKRISCLARGSSISNVYNSDLRTLKIHLPTLPEQRKIAGFLGAVDERIAQVTRKKALLEDYKKGCMQQLFSQSIRFKDDQGNDFPDWEEKRLGEVGITFGGLTGKSADDFGSGARFLTYLQVFKASQIYPEQCGFVEVSAGERQNKIQRGDIIFTTSSETPKEVGFASVVTEEMRDTYLNSFCFALRPNDIDALVPEFSRYLFRSEGYRSKVIPLAQGSTRYNLSKTSFLKLKLHFPHPNEQCKIADFLSAIDTKIDLLAQEFEQAKTFKKGLLQQMFV